MPPKLVNRIRKRSKDEDKKKATAHTVKKLEKSFAEVAATPPPLPPKPEKKLVMVIWYCPMGFPTKVLRGCEDLVADIARANKFDRAHIRSVPHGTGKRPDVHLTIDFQDPLTNLWTPAHVYVEIDEHNHVSSSRWSGGTGIVVYVWEILSDGRYRSICSSVLEVATLFSSVQKTITSAKGTARGGERMR